MAHEPDQGLFGPDSVSWQLHSDPMMWVAGVRALFLQALHPRAVRGIVANSDFRHDAWGRLVRTARFVSTVTYGTTEVAERAGARVRGVHRKLSATDPVTGRRYRLDAPDLLLWVHCAEVASYLHVLRRSGVRLTEAQAHTYVDEHRRAARLVGLDPATVPADASTLADYFRGVRRHLAHTDDTREIDDFLRRPPVPAPLLPIRGLLWSRLASLAYDSLPTYAHQLYGRPPRAPGVVTRELRATGALLRRVPSTLRWQLPPRRILTAVARLGPHARPSPYKLRRATAILDEPEQGQWGDDGGSGTRWGTPS